MKQIALNAWISSDPKKNAAMIVCLIMAAFFLWTVLAFFLVRESTEIAIKPAPRTNAGQHIDLKSPLFNNSLFGLYLPENATDAMIKQSMLDLKVVGILYSKNQKAAQVIIKIAGGTDKSFSVDDKLPGDVVIKRILPDSVVVLHNGALESLSLPKNELIFQTPAKPLLGE